MYPLHRYFPAFFLLFLPSFPARILQPDPITVVTPDSTPTWDNFTRFLDAVKGSHVSGMSELKKYLHRFGYLPGPPETTPNFTDFFDTDFESAVLTYQTNLGLPQTGKLDTETINSIVSPRCGVTDTVHKSTNNRNLSSLHTTGRFAYFYGKPRWARKPPLLLTYAFSPDNTITCLTAEEIKMAFRRAFSRWSAVIPVSFGEVKDYQKADVRIGFYSYEHGDGEPFDGVLGILAHGFSPENGRLHLDSAETWAVDFGTTKSKVAVDLESVATHEIGHVLGLGHSSVKEAVMYPSLSPRTRKVELRVDDVEGVQALYGSNPNFTFSSLLESENSSNLGVGLYMSTRLSLVWTVSRLVSVALFLFLGS